MDALSKTLHLRVHVHMDAHTQLHTHARTHARTHTKLSLPSLSSSRLSFHRPCWILPISVRKCSSFFALRLACSGASVEEKTKRNAKN